MPDEFKKIKGYMIPVGGSYGKPLLGVADLVRSGPHFTPTEAKQEYWLPLPCSGCAHSASGRMFPGRPSGERPCCFCVRNLEREAWHEKAKKDGKPLPLEWYDGSPMVDYPMDCYHSLNMHEQFRMWNIATDSPEVKKLKDKYLGLLIEQLSEIPLPGFVQEAKAALAAAIEKEKKGG